MRAERVSCRMLAYTVFWYVRPDGTSIRFANYAEGDPSLYAVDPSGVSHRFRATAIGKGTNGAKSALEKLDFGALSCRDAVVEVAKILYSQHDPAKDKPLELELSWVCEASGRLHKMVPRELHVEAEAAAKAAREAMDDD